MIHTSVYGVRAFCSDTKCLSFVVRTAYLFLLGHGPWLLPLLYVLVFLVNLFPCVLKDAFHVNVTECTISLVIRIPMLFRSLLPGREVDAVLRLYAQLVMEGIGSEH